MSEAFGETYHSTRGAMGEARHVFIEAGLNYEPICRQSGADFVPTEWASEGTVHTGTAPSENRGGAKDAPLSRQILEMGFGSGLNAWLTLLEAERTGRSVDYMGVELHPVPEEIAAQLGYTDDVRFREMHAAPWGEWTQISQGFRLLKLQVDVLDCFDLLSPQIVFWDAFSPETQPELWSEELFRRVFEAMAEGGVLTTYSAKGTVKRALQAAGFAVEKLAGAMGKRHMLRATRRAEKENRL